MKRRCFFFFLLFSALSACAADVSLQVKAEASRVYIGESLRMTVSVNGADRGLEEPDLSAFRDWADAELEDSQSSSRSSTVIINGNIKREVFEGRVFFYRLTPRKAGRFRLGPVRVKAGGKTYAQTGGFLDVVGVEEQDVVIASVLVSPATVLVEEPFSVTLQIDIRDLPEPYADENEPIHPNAPPHLQISLLDARQPDPGLTGPDLEKLLQGLVEQRRGQPSFTLNNYQTRDMMSGFDSLFGGDPFRPRPIRFRFPATRVQRDGKSYRRYSLKLDYTAHKETELSFGPLTFKGSVMTGVKNRRAESREIYTIAPAVAVKVVPPPEEGRPDSFIGAVGRGMKAAASLDASVCKVGDPLSLTLEVTGEISIANLRPPALNVQTNLTKDFRIYDQNVKTDTLPNGKRFTYRVRPIHAGTLEFPPVEVAYYDSEKRAYATLSTEPIPVQAQATAQIATELPEDAPEAADEVVQVSAAPKGSGITLSPEGMETHSLFVPVGVSAAVLWLLAFTAPLLALLVWLAPAFARAVAALRARRRTGGAQGRALRALRQAADAAATARVVRDYLAERLGIPNGASLTPSEAVRLLSGNGCPPDAAQACGDALARLDEALYRPDNAVDIEAEKAGIRALLPQLDDALGARGKRNGAAVLLALLLIPCTALAATPADSARAFLWNQARAQSASASVPAEFRKAAETYNRLVADGARNGPLFLNLGNTLVMAGDGVNAAAAFARAERYLGANAETRRGIAGALALQSGNEREELPWTRVAFFWHYELPCSVRVVVALTGWTLLWLGVALLVRERRRGKHGLLASLAGTCLATGALVCAAFTASVVLTAAQERHDDATWGARVFESLSSEESAS